VRSTYHRLLSSDVIRQWQLTQILINLCLFKEYLCWSAALPQYHWFTWRCNAQTPISVSHFWYKRTRKPLLLSHDYRDQDIVYCSGELWFHSPVDRKQWRLVSCKKKQRLNKPYSIFYYKNSTKRRFNCHLT
jgi:hypothetical protein